MRRWRYLEACSVQVEGSIAADKHKLTDQLQKCSLNLHVEYNPKYLIERKYIQKVNEEALVNQIQKNVVDIEHTKS